MLGGDKPWKHLDAALGDNKVVVAAAKRLRTAFDNPQSPALATIHWCELIKMDHAMRNAVHRLVRTFAGEIVKHENSRRVARKIVLQRQNLPPVSQRALRKQPYLRQAVDHHARRLDALDCLQNPRDCFAELEIG